MRIDSFFIFGNLNGNNIPSESEQKFNFQFQKFLSPEISIDITIEMRNKVGRSHKNEELIGRRCSPYIR